MIFFSLANLQVIESSNYPNRMRLSQIMWSQRRRQALSRVFLSELVLPSFFSSTWIKLAHWSLSRLCWKWNEVTSMCQHSESFQLFSLIQQNRLACGVSPIEEQIDHVFHHCTTKSLEFQSAMHVPSQPKSPSLPLNKVHVLDYVTYSILLQGTEFSEW